MHFKISYCMHLHVCMYVCLYVAYVNGLTFANLSKIGATRSERGRMMNSIS